MSTIEVNPPTSLLNYDAPLFVGMETKNEKVTKNRDLSSTKLEDCINSMLPPREWTEDSGTWVQYVSKQRATRLDVISLQEHLDKKLNERKARETGICPVREQLYDECLDELIRHVALDGIERGLLLLRVRDEIKMTIDAYKTLFHSSVTFGIKKQIKSEHGIPDLEEQVKKLEEKKAELELESYELRTKMDIIEKWDAEQRITDDKRRKEELDFLKYQGQHLDSFLKQMNSAK